MDVCPSVYAPPHTWKRRTVRTAAADDHVQRVHAGQGEIEEKEDLRVFRRIRRHGNIPFVRWMDKVLNAEVGAGNMVLGIFPIPLVRLHAKKGEPQDKRED